MEPTKKSERALAEESVLAFWKENNIFEKTLKKDSPKGEFVFFEGPPTANAKPALHHLEARAFKDVIPRYKTMQGFSVPRRAGWDTHGLPVELQIEKKLGLTSKKEIEQFGIAAFNKECKDSVFTYIKDWEEFTDRIGYWVDKKNAYYTFNNSYIESLWNIVGTVEQKGLLYKDYKIIPWCARCGTALSSHELAQGYMDVKDLSVYAKFHLRFTNEDFLRSSGHFVEVNAHKAFITSAYILAWTTTPWTLPGNVALAVGNDIDYVVVLQNEQYLILAKERLALIEGVYEIVAEVKGSDLVGLEYEPLYPYLSELLNKKDASGVALAESEKLVNAYKVYAADFVTTTDGTGVVHTAVMYGADDFDLGTAVGLPKFHMVGVDGKFIAGSGPFEGRFVKPARSAGGDEDVAIDIIKDLAHRGLLFKKEKYEHSYPHCWRCKTPLIYYARDSWYIGMSQLTDELVAQNENINWEPSHIKEGRFGEWLRNIKDWAISRERYWGTPLPIWIAEDKQRIVVDSIDTMKSLMKKSGNSYMVMRHGQTQHNVEGLWNYGNQDGDPLTEKGKEQVLATAGTLKAGSIDMIIASPFLRTLETAQIIAKELGLSKEQIVTDVHLAEWNVGGDYDGKPLDDFFVVRNASTDRYNFKAEGGESYIEILKRAGEFMYRIEKEYSGKNILIVSHGAVTRGIDLVARGTTHDMLFATTRDYVNFDNAEVRLVDFVPLPHNEHYELDLHRPYIDEVVLVQDGKEYRRIKEVMDVWFDSGAMPFAQHHYPFENKEYVESVGYPADFISEAIDQTRGWFYTLHAIGVLMGRGNAYKNAICLGHLLDDKGKKMSKSVGNIVDPWEQMAKYGVDTLRLWMYSVNQPGDSKNYDEKTVVELNRQVFGLLYNVLSFYELYRDTDLELEGPNDSKNVLDMWIIARLNQFIALTTESMDNYKTFEPVRALRAFMDDLSTWYVRRSRERIKEGGRASMDTARHDSAESAKRTLYTVLKTVAQIMAPFAPFAAEDIWQKLKTADNVESVHLSSWPTRGEVDEYVLSSMEQVRTLCTLGNALRKKVAVPVRQPLLALRVKSLTLDEEYLALVMDELNVKAVVQDDTIKNDVELDLTMTEDLKQEGIVRELMRLIQDNRKASGLQPDDRIMLTIGTTPEGQKIITTYVAELSKTVGADSIEFTDTLVNEVTIENIPFSISF